MTIDEMIRLMREIYEEEREEAYTAIFPPYADDCIERAENCKQIVEWLEELKKLREFKEKYHKGMEYAYSTYMYRKAIDDFAEKIAIYGTYDDYGNVVHVLEIAEKLKKECAE